MIKYVLNSDTGQMDQITMTDQEVSAFTASQPVFIPLAPPPSVITMTDQATGVPVTFTVSNGVFSKQQ